MLTTLCFGTKDGSRMEAAEQYDEQQYQRDIARLEAHRLALKEDEY